MYIETLKVAGAVVKRLCVNVDVIISEFTNYIALF